MSRSNSSFVCLRAFSLVALVVTFVFATGVVHAAAERNDAITYDATTDSLVVSNVDLVTLSNSVTQVETVTETLANSIAESDVFSKSMFKILQGLAAPRWSIPDNTVFPAFDVDDPTNSGSVLADMIEDQLHPVTDPNEWYPLEYSVVNGSLPAGLALTAQGNVTGTLDVAFVNASIVPPAKLLIPFTVRVTNANGVYDDRSFAVHLWRKMELIGEAGSRFGLNGVGISDDGSVVVVGARYSNAYEGDAVVYQRNSNASARNDDGHNYDGPMSLTNDAAALGLGEYGAHTALSDDGLLACVAIPYNDDNNLTDAGAAAFFTRASVMDDFTFLHKVYSDAPAAGKAFSLGGIALSADGTVAVVAEYNYDTGAFVDVGAVHVFRLDTGSGQYLLNQTILPPVLANDTQFGRVLRISGDGTILAVGMTNSIAELHVYRFNNTLFAPLDVLPAPECAGGIGYQGFGLSTDGEVLVVGRNQCGPDKEGEARVHMLSEDGSGYEHVQNITGEDSVYGDQLGYGLEVSRDGKTFLAGARVHNVDGINNAGAAYVFVWSETLGKFEQTRKVTARAPAAGDQFARFLSLSADGRIAVASTLSAAFVGVFEL